VGKWGGDWGGGEKTGGGSQVEGGMCRPFHRLEKFAVGASKRISVNRKVGMGAVQKKGIRGGGM